MKSYLYTLFLHLVLEERRQRTMSNMAPSHWGSILIDSMWAGRELNTKLVCDSNTGHLLRFWRELSLSPTTAEAFLIQTVQVRTHWLQSTSQSISLSSLKSNVEKVWPESALPRFNTFILERKKSSGEGHCVLFGKTKFHLLPIMNISFWNKTFKG